ncbi:hypothetical protein WDW89_21440 [Deltaproteobacteria bacterium TL4]
MKLEIFKTKVTHASFIFGIVILVIGLWRLSVWRWSVAEFLRGTVPIVLILFGLTAIGAGLSELKKVKNITENED